MRSFITEKDPAPSKLEKGNTLYQILSNSNFIFKVSSTFEKLYRYKYDPNTNEVDEIRVYKRVRHGSKEISDLLNMQPYFVHGVKEAIKGKRYDIYSLTYERVLRGYMLSVRVTYSYNENVPSERMYFTLEKCEKKGR